MSAEMIAIIAVGVAIMGVQISTCICLARRMDGMRRGLNVELVQMAAFTKLSGIRYYIYGVRSAI